MRTFVGLIVDIGTFILFLMLFAVVMLYAGMLATIGWGERLFGLGKCGGKT